MSILVNDTKFITQGMTGNIGTFHTEQALAYGLNGRRRYAGKVRRRSTIAAMQAVGIRVAASPSELGTTLAQLLNS